MLRLGIGLALSVALLAGCSKPAEDYPDQEPSTAPEPTATESTTPVVEAASEAAPDPAILKAVEALPAPLNTADYANGQKQFAKCKSCHTISSDKKNLTGPSLYGVFGRTTATVEGYTYSDAMKSHGGKWDATTLDAYLKAPSTVVKGTKMSFAGIKNDKDRTDLIAYLAVEGQK